MTRQEIIKFIEQILEINPKAFVFEDEGPIIEDNYIFLPAVEFKRDSNTNEWVPI